MNRIRDLRPFVPMTPWTEASALSNEGTPIDLRTMTFQDLAASEPRRWVGYRVIRKQCPPSTDPKT
jgi:hypothetical protein